MPINFTDYLEDSTEVKPISFTDYLESNSPSTFDKPNFTDYLSPSYDVNQYKSILPKKEELSPSSPMGLSGSFFSGLASGMSLGYYGQRTPEEYQAMTTGEKVFEAIGNIAGGTLPFVGLSLATGGFGTPVAGAKYMKDAYKALNLINKNKKAINASNKTIGNLQNRISKVKNANEKFKLKIKLKKEEK